MKLPTCAALSLLILVSASGCAFALKWGQGDENGTPVWPNAIADREDALMTAQEHCAQFGKAATEKSRNGNRVDFACVEPAALRRIVPIRAIDAAAFADIKSAPQIHAVHYQHPPFRLDPPRQPRSVRNPGVADGLLHAYGGALLFPLGVAIDVASMASQQAEADRFDQQLEASEQRGARLVEDHALTDPILVVKSSVLHAVRQAGLNNVREVAKPFNGWVGDRWKATEIREGIVLELGTREWSLRTSTRSFDFIAYGQLRRLGGDSPLWAAQCHFPQQPLPAVAVSQRESGGLGAALKERLAEVAKACAAGLAASLLQGGNSQ